MTSTILLLGPLTVIIGCLYWVMSLGKEQAALMRIFGQSCASKPRPKPQTRSPGYPGLF